VREAVEAAGGGETPIYGRGGQPPLLHRRAVNLKVDAAGFEHGQAVAGRPLEQIAQIMAVSVESATAVAGQERYGCQLRRIHGVLGAPGTSTVEVIVVTGVPPSGRGTQPRPTSRVVDVRTIDHMIYHMVMGRREVLVQLDDDLVDRLDRLAEQQGTNRSDLLRRGAAAVLEAAELAEADRALQESYRRLPQDPAIVSVASRLASLTAPEW
jgi:hypothetical protein